jgi:indole-3-glycerol phosphate synthase
LQASVVTVKKGGTGTLAAGADAILLIVAAFPAAPAPMLELAALAADLGLDVLTEVHTAAELEIALASTAPLIGINNRDLKTFHTTLDVTFQLAPRVPADRLLVSESGIATHADLVRLAGATRVDLWRLD